MTASSFSFWRVLTALIITGLCGFIGYGYLQFRVLENENSLLSAEGNGLRLQLSAEKNNSEVLNDALNVERSRNGASELTISQLSAGIRDLENLVATDPELLKKYSKVYFLSENYVPAQLSGIDQRYLYEQRRTQLFLSQALPHLQNLIISAASAGDVLKVVSGYRSFYDQEAVKQGYSFVYGAGTANQFSADQGYSEHQLGTAVDFNTPGTSGILAGFDKSKAFTWLMANAYKFGFILSYPKGNGYYQFEPWHWRFVGVKLATYLYEQGKNFYDLDQRVIDEYLISLFN